MDITILVIGIVILLVAIGLIVSRQRKRTDALKDRFGPEYSRLVEETGGARKAERTLEERAERVEAMSLKPLSAADKRKYHATWHEVQADFVDNPERALTDADNLLTEVMAARGYPVGDFDQRSADLSVEHPGLVQNYRAANDIATRHKRGDAGTEDLRRGMIHYRALFDEIIEKATEPA